MSVLRKPEVSAKYIRNYVGSHADFSELELDDNDPRHDMIKRHNPKKWRPVMVFLDSQGKEVARITAGLKSVEEALLLDRFVSGKHYQKGDFAAFRKAQKG